MDMFRNEKNRDPITDYSIKIANSQALYTFLNEINAFI